ncbi:MAG: dihydroorotase [Opitutae bacterium]|jgi:dihydroorotase|nr:dihydroorotase [Opitutae bacterium]
MKTICLKGGRIIDPSTEKDEKGDLYFYDDKIISPKDAKNIEVIDVTGKIIFPGLVDLRCHINDLSGGNCENIFSVTRAAAAGGYSTIVLMPNLNPIPDNPATIQFIKDQIKRDACINVKLTGCLTKGSNGKALAPLGSLKNAGVVAITDSPLSPQDNQIFCKAVEYASMFDLPVIDLPRDLSLSENGNAHDGPSALKMGLGGYPRIAEELFVQRAISIARSLNTRVHLSSISSFASVDLIKEAKNRNVMITADVSPQHLALTETKILNYDTNFKTTPPLREEVDRKYLIDGLMDGTIDCISTAHEPIKEYEKNIEYDLAPTGVTSLETAFNISLQQLSKHQKFTWVNLLKFMSLRPSEIINVEGGELRVGSTANIVIFDPLKKWKYHPSKSKSRAFNTPFNNEEFHGKVSQIYLNGKAI